MINVTRASKWMDSISQADFEEILSKFEKGNPAAIELFDIMCQKGCADYGSYTDTIAVTKRIFDYKWFDSGLSRILCKLKSDMLGYPLAI